MFYRLRGDQSPYMSLYPGPDPVYAIQLLHSFDLLPSLFIVAPQVAATIDGVVGSMEQSIAGVEILYKLLSSTPDDPEPSLPSVHPTLLHLALKDKSTRARLTLAAALSPFRGITYKVKSKTVTLVEHVIREGLKVLVCATQS